MPARITARQLQALIATCRCPAFAAPCFVWREFRDFERLEKLGFVRRTGTHATFATFKATPAGRVRLREALGAL